VGIAAMGTAVGAPLYAVLGLGGLLSGSYFDSFKLLSDEKTIKTKVSKELYGKLQHDAAYLNMDIEQLLLVMIHNFYERDTEKVSSVAIK
ncbi:hypothetical protein BIZ37_28880, partial [Photobacterium sp. BZF1]|uniref:hypothetical protein n=1 Tax=Photobacterium sp. BZF1 TaxID=1904457 RepID=UPI001653DCE6